MATVGTNRSEHGPERPHVKLLTPAEEFELVSELARVRGEVLPIIKPFFAFAAAETRLDHFDQQLTFHLSARRALAKPQGRKLSRLVAQYREAKGRLVVANLPWVTKLARAQRHATIPEDDFFQEGVCGLLKAIDRFEPERGLRLMTYATWYIREAMQQLRARQSHQFSISTHDQTLLGQVEVLANQFQHEHGRAPDAKEIPQQKASVAQVRRLRQAVRPMASLERAGQDGALPVPTPDPTREFDRHEALQVAVDKLLAALPDREREIVSRRFGVGGYDAEPLETLGAEFSVSKERVRQLQRQALRRIQEHAAANGVTVDLD